MAGMEHPLKCLRECVLNGLKMYEKGDYIVLGNMAFQKSCTTNYVVWNKKKEYYTLESLYFFVKNRSLVHTCYVKEAAAKNIQIVTRPDRKSLEDYLTNEKSERPPHNVDNSAPLCPFIPVKDLEAQLAEPEMKRARLNQEELARKERLFAMLGKGVVVEQDAKFNEPVRELSKDFGLTADKIAALRSKALARKRTQIQTIEDDLEDVPKPVAVAAAGTDGSHQETQLVTQEIVYTTMDSILEAPGTDFASFVFPILTRLGLHHDKSDGSKPRVGSTAMAMDALRRSGGAPWYSRYDQDRFKRGGMGDFHIDTKQTFTMTGVMNWTNSELAGEMLGSNIYAAYRHGTGQGMPISLKMVKDGNQTCKRVSKTPIIVVPATPSSLITMWNARDLLQDLRFVSTDEVKRKVGNNRETEVLINRRHDKLTSLPYRIVDSPVRFSSDEWSSVLAVFVQGPAWQFKGWPLGSDPPAIFKKVCAFHLKWEDDKLDANVANWGVNVISLSRTRRHLDKGALGKFWDTLDKFVLKTKEPMKI